MNYPTGFDFSLFAILTFCLVLGLVLRLTIRGLRPSPILGAVAWTLPYFLFYLTGRLPLVALLLPLMMIILFELPIINFRKNA